MGPHRAAGGVGYSGAKQIECFLFKLFRARQLTLASWENLDSQNQRETLGRPLAEFSAVPTSFARFLR